MRARNVIGGISYRSMTDAELPRLADIDRSETIRTAFEARGVELVQVAVEWDVTTFLAHGDGDHTIAAQIAFCRRHLAADAIMIGGFHRDQLVGIGLLTPEVRPRMAQLAYLQVSRPHRRTGVGSSIARMLIGVARDRGSDRIYVSATPSQSAVSFYRRLGFAPVAHPLPELYELEPRDIHMIMQLGE